MARYCADEHRPYFCTITVLDWLPVLIEARYIDPILESLAFSRQRKGLCVYAFVVMPNHMHLMVSSEANLHTIMRYFKRFTSRAIHDRLKQDGRTTMLGWLRHATQRARQEAGELGLWSDGFHPQHISSPAVLRQKLNYLHQNPVRKGLVVSPQDWWYSSARNYAGLDDVCFEIDSLEL